MRNSILKFSTGFVLAMVGVFTAKGQNVPVSFTPASPVAVPVPAAYTRSTINFVRTFVPAMPTTDTALVRSGTLTPRQVQQTTVYADGLGRPFEMVVKAWSSNGKDVVKSTLYDGNGLTPFSYLPYAPYTGNAANMIDGKFKLDPFQKQADYYSNATLNPGGWESYFFAQTEYENSPLHRVLKTYQPGIYAKNAGNKFKQYDYLTNFASDSVRIWTFANGALIPTSAAGKIYADSSLYKNVVTDEGGNQIVEYKDKEGHLILRKIQNSATPGTAHVGWACTYFGYDDLGNKTIIIPPIAVEAINGAWVITPAIAAGYCYQYRFDGLGRKIVEQIPGKDSVETVYDQRDRPIAVRNGILRSSKSWVCYFYDNLDRQVKTTTFTFDFNRSQMQAYQDGSVFDPQRSFPLLDSSAMTTLVYNYYDEYLTGSIAYNGADIGKVQALSNPYAEPLPATPNLLPRGLLTGKKIRIMGSDPVKWLISTIYYNDKGRTIQTVTDNITGGRNVTNNLFDFSGKLLSSYERITNPLSTLTPQITILTMNHFDAGGRLDSVKVRLNDVVADTRTIAVMDYDDLEHLIQKRLDPALSTQLETLDFEYDLRGKLTSINKAYLNTPGSTDRSFGQQLFYENSFSTVFYDGCIAGMKWKGSDGIARTYGYSYDNQRRLTKADFNQQNKGSSLWTHDERDFKSSFSYDIAGNLKTMVQKGMNGTAIQTIDSIKYGLVANSNRLDFATDKVNNPATLLDDFFEFSNNESSDYAYDLDGNMVKDRNNGIDTILYDYQSKPTIVLTNTGPIYFTYDALGNKHKKFVVDTTAGQGTNEETHYVDGLIYEQNVLQYIPHSEGRIRPVYKAGQAVRYVYEYDIKNYQGSIVGRRCKGSDTAIYSATGEIAARALEDTTYSRIDETVTNVKPTGYPVDNTTSPNDYIFKTNGATQKMGPSIVLRVQKGDTISAIVKAFYLSSAANTSSYTPTDMVTALLSSFSTGGIKQGAHFSNGPGSPIMSLNALTYQQIRDQNPSQNQPAQPKAYMGYVLYSDGMKKVDNNSGVRQAQGSPNVLFDVVLSQIVIEESGFLYLYLCNETNENVFWDGFTVKHVTGPILEDNAYYPYGLRMAGISSSALKGGDYPLNNRLFLGKELQHNEFRSGRSLNLYDFDKRLFDPRLGCFHSPDPLAEQMSRFSVYAYGFGNPVSFIDPDGMLPTDVILTGKEAQAAFAEIQKAVKDKLNVTMDEKTGKLSYTKVDGAKQDKKTEQLMTAIDDHTVEVNAYADNRDNTSGGNLLIGGALMGTVVTAEKTTTDGKPSDVPLVLSFQEMNVKNLSDMSTFNGKDGQDVLHEVTESYHAGKNSQKSGKNYSFKPREYRRAHKAAVPQTGKVSYRFLDNDGKPAADPNTAPRTDIYIQRRGKELILRQLILTKP